MYSDYTNIFLLFIVLVFVCSCIASVQFDLCLANN